MHIVVFLFGIIAIYIGANLLVSGASKFSRSVGVSPLIIGLTIVGIGTSLPETVVGIISGIKKTSEISFGNIIGADIFDLCFVIGISAIVQPLIVNLKLIQRELKWLLGVILGLFLVASDSNISFFDGVILIFVNIIYFVYCYICVISDRRDAEILAKEIEGVILRQNRKKSILYFLQTIFGLIILISGGEIIVRSAIKFIELWNLTGEFIGMTIVSFATALPELTTSVVASARKESDISIGNVIGTVIYNTSGIVGIVSVINNISVRNILLVFQLPVLLLISIFFFPLICSKRKISLIEGTSMIITYLLFLTVVFHIKVLF